MVDVTTSSKTRNAKEMSTKGLDGVFPWLGIEGLKVQ